MHIWSQIAILGAFVAAFGPPVLTEADDQPEQVVLPTLGFTDQPVAEAVDVDARPTRDELANMNPPDQFAAIQAAVEPSALPTQNGGRRPGTTAQGKPDLGQARRPRGWHGAGQRYG